MSYLVFARKYRPSGFCEVIGQEHISELLKKAIESGRIAHAYLFCGPRGIGKTSCARILAKCLNCLKGPTATPCGECAACREIANATSFDVLEIDGASNRGIDDIRALRENVKFAPAVGKFKIYIIDEVHMVTTEAFNALLKTLEEPPPHVKFILATTAPQKVPATIISRCQRFDFKRIPVKTIVGVLAEISRKEKLKVDEDALFAIAKAAQGSFRDALSILDQLSALGESKVAAEDVYSMLGLVETEYLFELADTLGRKDCAQALAVLEKIIDKGKDTKQLAADLIEHFRNLMVIKIGGPPLGSLVDTTAAVKERLQAQAQQFSVKEMLRAIEIFMGSQDTARITEQERLPLELACAKFCYEEKKAALPQAQAGIPAPADLRNNPVSSSVIKPMAIIKPKEVEEDPQPIVPEPVAVAAKAAPNVTLNDIKAVWETLTYAVSKEKMSLGQYLQDGFPVSYTAPKLVIGFSKDHSFHKESLESAPNRKVVEKIFSDRLKIPVILQYNILEDFTPEDQPDPKVTAVLDTFKGKVVSKWHNS